MVSSCSDPVIQKKKKTLGHISDIERPERLNDHRHVGHCVHARVVVYISDPVMGPSVHVFDFCHDWKKYLRDLHQSDVH